MKLKSLFNLLLLLFVSFGGTKAEAALVFPVEKIIENKIYVDSTAITIKDSVILLKINESLTISLDELCADDDGLYTRAVFEACPYCGSLLVFGIYCMNPACSSNN
jgi:hypothetical protein